jgi:hypothetical protein
MTEEQLVGIWIIDPVEKTRLAAVNEHYDKHGVNVNATDVEQYVRKAVAFREEAKKRNGVRKPVPGRTPGVRSWKKLGYFIHLTPNNEIVSFGTTRKIYDTDF